MSTTTVVTTKENAFERFFKKVGHVIEWPFVHGEEVIEILTTALKDTPAVKTAITGLVAKIKQVAEDSALAIAARGLDVPDDIQTVTDAKELWTYVTGTFLPAVEAACKDLELDVTTADPAPPVPVVAATAAPATEPAFATTLSGPGLHNAVSA